MTRPDDTHELTEGLMAGETEAIENYYEEFFSTMFHQAQRSIGADEQTCLDLVHDAMLKMLKSIRVMESRSKLRAWTKKLVASVAIDFLRKRRSQLRLAQRAAANSEAEASNEELERVEARLMWLSESLSLLDADSRRLVTMRYRWGWTLKRIADAIGLNPGAVDGRLGRIVEQLRSQAEGVEHD
ncbi:RNA polymerase sigma factor SigV [Thalassoglobus neptunius]|uniref:RNA polymerase sigma factor SigV n=1 Tax=Thalassoglobus neptunius TaxID=1938619 RepID=A0A5C5X1T4_9PLAN|nr:sigma-70 family RNA polymerase sigma factor [Thalassoglobus neptunius]TWT56780.1 RNA polymerase sigma factor SigV [Thalassoglobus neptunius]